MADTLQADRRGVQPQLRAPRDLIAQWATIDGAAAHMQAWRELHARSIEPNPFYAPPFVLSGVHLPEGAQTRVLMIWRPGVEGEARRLVGLFPLVDDRKRYFVPLPMLRAAEFYGTLSTPLLDSDRPEETWAAMLDALERAGIRALLLGYAHEGGTSYDALVKACTRTRRVHVELGRHERAMLRSEDEGDAYIRATLETRRRKEADRQRRRLAESGELAFRIARDPSDVDAALDAFLDLEAAGWKGQRGTDLRSAPGSAAFIRGVARMMAADGTIRIVSLTSSGRPVAVGIVVMDGARAYYIKTTYDETFARFSPGLLLTLDLTRHLLDDTAIADADSIANADHPMIDRIWTERLPIASVFVSCRPREDAIFGLIVRAERLRERLRLITAGLRARLAILRRH